MRTPSVLILLQATVTMPVTPESFPQGPAPGKLNPSLLGMMLVSTTFHTAEMNPGRAVLAMQVGSRDPQFPMFQARPTADKVVGVSCPQ